MNLRNNKGYVGQDIAISMIIIIIFIPTVFGIAYNIQKTNNTLKRESTAVSIATEVLEIAKSEQYSDVTLDNSSNFLLDLNEKYTLSTYSNSDTQEEGYEYVYYQSIGEDDAHYQIQIGLQNYYPDENSQEDLVKKINVLVFYPSGDTQETINISTVLQDS